MGIYEHIVLPRLLALAMRHRDLVPHRERVACAAEGRVLEVGIGSGLNLSFYGPGVREVVGIDPSPSDLAGYFANGQNPTEAPPRHPLEDEKSFSGHVSL